LKGGAILKNIEIVLEESCRAPADSLLFDSTLRIAWRPLQWRIMVLPSLILASASPRRVQLLREMGFDFRVVISNAAESQPRHLSPGESARLNAHRKAIMVARRHPESLVIGADTVVCLGSETFGKPADMDHARTMLSALEGKSHQVITGVCLVHWAGGKVRLFAESTEVVFRQLSPENIEDYLAKTNPLDKAGAYAIQEHGDLIVSRISGSFSNVVGLPVERLQVELTHWKQPS
jgi:septum formation protein